MDPILPILSILGHWAILLGSFGGPGKLPGTNLAVHPSPTASNRLSENYHRGRLFEVC